MPDVESWRVSKVWGGAGSLLYGQDEWEDELEPLDKRPYGGDGRTHACAD